MSAKNPAPAANLSWPADAVVRRSVAALVPYARNARTHSPEQIAQLAASIKEWGWTVPVLVDEESNIIAGHGRVLAAQSLGFADVPVMVATGWSEQQKRAYVIADNKLALNAGWDEEVLKLELLDIQAGGFDLGLTGFGTVDLAALFPQVEAETPNQAGPSGVNYQEQFGVIVICKDAAHQERVYNELLEAGHECRVVVT